MSTALHQCEYEHDTSVHCLCTWRLCVCKLLDWLKLLLHIEHLYGLSPVWTLMWLSRCPELLNALSHMRHLYGFSPLWLLLCLTRLPDCVNRLLQTVHSNGFSPEWLLMCSARLLLTRQHLPHSVHLYLPVWIFICIRRPACVKNHFSHWPHVYPFSPVCLDLFLSKWLFVINRLSRTSQRYFFSPCCVFCDLSILLCHQLYSFPEMSFLLDKHQHITRKQMHRRWKAMQYRQKTSLNHSLYAIQKLSNFCNCCYRVRQKRRRIAAKIA